MFIDFSQNKIRYESGQVFPFLIAIICVIIIMAMIAVNLGQLALYRTDVSNAADAGALAGSSVISGQLLSYGLTSDFMCGQNLVKTAAMVYALGAIDPPWNIITAVAIMGTIMTSNMTTLMKAFTDSQMAWTNARKTALQYAFSNVGVDEPRPTYEDFLDCKRAPCWDGDVNPANRAPATTINYDEYIMGTSTDATRYARNGFAKFMDNSKNGFWVDSLFGSVEQGPGAQMPTPLVTNGYGWQRDPNNPRRFINSFENRTIKPNPTCVPYGSFAECVNNKCWTCYDNWVEVTTRSRLMYSFELVQVPGQSAIAATLSILVFFLCFVKLLPKMSWAGPFAALIAALIALAIAAVTGILINAIRFGLDFPGKSSTVGNEFIEGSPMEVTVKRYRKSSDVTLWKFRYGESWAPIKAKSWAIPFHEKGNESIAPSPKMLWATLISLIFNPAVGMVYIIANWNNIFETQIHLFETKIQDTE